MYNYKCEYCSGIVETQLINKEVFKYKSGFVMIENAPIGVCNKCGYRYYHASIIRQVHNIAQGKQLPYRTEALPVAVFNQS